MLPAYDYCLKCSHTFNILDARGAISVTERTHYIGRVRALARRVAEALSEAARGDGLPALKVSGKGSRPAGPGDLAARAVHERQSDPGADSARTLWARNCSSRSARRRSPPATSRPRWRISRPRPAACFGEQRLTFTELRTLGTPRRLTLFVDGLTERQADQRREVVGPPKAVAFDAEGKPTKAAEGFARAQGVAGGAACRSARWIGASTWWPSRRSGRRRTREVLVDAAAQAHHRPLLPQVHALGRGHLPLRPAHPLAAGRLRRAGRALRGGRPRRPTARRTATASWPRAACGSAASRSTSTSSEERFVIVDPARRRELVRDAGDRGGGDRGWPAGPGRGAGGDGGGPGRVSDRGLRRLQAGVPGAAARGHRHPDAEAPALLPGGGRRRRPAPVLRDHLQHAGQGYGAHPRGQRARPARPA